MKRYLIFASDSPTYLLRISGPLTIFGSRALSILPICLAINVLPVPRKKFEARVGNDTFSTK